MVYQFRPLIFKARDASWPSGIKEGFKVTRHSFFSNHNIDIDNPAYRREGYFLDEVKGDPVLVVERKFGKSIPLEEGRDRVVVTLMYNQPVDFAPIENKILENAKKMGLERILDDKVPGTSTGSGSPVG